MRVKWEERGQRRRVGSRVAMAGEVWAARDEGREGASEGDGVASATIFKITHSKGHTQECVYRFTSPHLPPLSYIGNICSEIRLSFQLNCINQS